MEKNNEIKLKNIDYIIQDLINDIEFHNIEIEVLKLQIEAMEDMRIKITTGK